MKTKTFVVTNRRRQVHAFRIKSKVFSVQPGESVELTEEQVKHPDFLSQYRYLAVTEKESK